MEEDGFYSKIAGVSMKNDDGSSRQEIIKDFAHVGDQLILRREPKNKYDPNAIGVWLTVKSCTGSADRQLGYIEARTAAEMSPNIDRGDSDVYAVITSITGGEGREHVGVNIKIIEK